MEKNSNVAKVSTLTIDNMDTLSTETLSTVTPNAPAPLVKLDDNGNIDITLLSDSDKEQYSKLTQSIRLQDINSVANFGAELQNTMNRSSNALLSAVRTNQAGDEIGSLVNNLLSELSCIDVNELAPQSKFKQFLSRIPILGSVVKNAEKLMRKYDTVEKNVDEISKKIVATRMVSLRDNNALQKMFQDNIEYIKQIEELIIAGKIKQSEIEEQLKQMLDNPMNYESYEIADVQEFASSLDRRISDMVTLRYVMRQSLPQIRLVQNNNLQTANKAQSIIATTIPVWRNQLSIAVALNNQHNSIVAQRKVVDATNEIMKRNADMLHQNSIDVAKENERNVIDIETLRETTEKLINTIKEVKEIHEQGAIQRKQVESELLRIESEMGASLISQNQSWQQLSQ